MPIARSLQAGSSLAPNDTGAMQVAYNGAGPARRRTNTPAHLREEARHFKLLRQLMQESKVLTRRFGISPQLFDAMLEVTVCTEPDGISIGGLAVRLGIKHNSVVGIVNRLSAKGLALRVDCPQDGRRVCVRATQQGQALLLALVQAMQQSWSHEPAEHKDGGKT